ncbi:MAG: 2-isopropylmalate synthase [Candidatus Thermoplasmatota archaeon]|nr:2-isopropylmalate synthase [Candidatus Thermoplasmatota archaeon]MBU1915252.1 2-isopropylmalate synthase [Candidatus Thermoplasmatota archaeon]
MPERVKILDTTLRDGEQTPNVALSSEDKVKIAQALDELGVDIIEAGFPINSEGEADAVSRIAGAGLKAEICALCRASPGDIDAALACDVDSVHIFLATSKTHLEKKLKITQEEARDKAVAAVQYAKDHGLIAEFSCEDGTRTELGFLDVVHKAIQEVGVDRIDIADTVGVMTPTAMTQFVAEIKKSVKVPLAVHCHDDFGMSVANSLAGVLGGAEEVHCTINGLGERAGNAALEEVVMGLQAFYNVRTNINTRKMAFVSRLVSQLTGVAVQPNKAIVGENAFSHEAGIHVHGVMSECSTYEPMRPEIVGKERKFVIGKHSGAHSVDNKLREYGLELDKDQMKEVVTRVKKWAESGKKLDDAELLAVAYDVMGQEAEPAIKLEEFTVFTGLNFTPTATVVLNIDGETRRASETGVGPIDASVCAIKAAVSKNIVLNEYRLEAITGGSNALCEVTVKLGDCEDAQLLSLGKSVGSDIVTTSVDAMIEGLNRLWVRKLSVSNGVEKKRAY